MNNSKAIKADETAPVQWDVERLRSVFSSVAPKEDWRGPIDVIIPNEDLHVTIAAIEFFTATMAEVEIVTNKCVRVTSIGYRAGPAGP